jgi:nitroreductase
VDFQELIRIRRSVRHFKPDELADDLLTRVLSAAVVAPSAANLQPWTLIVVTNPEIRTRFKEVYSRDWFWQAPALVVGCVEPARAWHRKDGYCSAEVDLAIAMDHLVLAATEEGLGTCWVCAFDEEKTKEILNIPPNVRVIAMTPLGYPNQAPEEPRALIRKQTKELIRRNVW